MNAKIRWVVLLICVAAWNAYGAFEKPTREQLKAAAKEVSLIVDLLKDASIDQAAETAKDVIIQIVQLDLKPVERDSRIASLAAYLFATMASDQWRALAISLAKFVAASPAASMSPATVSATQRAVIEIAGVDIGNEFGNIYNLAMQTVAGAPGGGKTVPPQPPPPPVALPLRPPVATLYEGQQYP